MGGESPRVLDYFELDGWRDGFVPLRISDFNLERVFAGLQAVQLDLLFDRHLRSAALQRAYVLAIFNDLIASAVSENLVGD